MDTLHPLQVIGLAGPDSAILDIRPTLCMYPVSGVLSPHAEGVTNETLICGTMPKPTTPACR